jgi:hypothetical protein
MTTPATNPTRRYTLALRSWLATQPPAGSESERLRQLTTFRILFNQARPPGT